MVGVDSVTGGSETFQRERDQRNTRGKVVERRVRYDMIEGRSKRLVTHGTTEPMKGLRQGGTGVGEKKIR